MASNKSPSGQVSVAIAAYNHAAFVRECVQSVQAQSFANWEIVVTDDGSVDGTADVLRSLAAEDDRIRLNAFSVNQGACAALNDAIDRAQGEFIAVLNSDDCFLPDKLERQVAFLRSNSDCAAVFGLPHFIDEHGHPFRDDSHKDFNIFSVPNRTRAEWLRHFFRYGNCLCHPTAVVRRRCYSELGGYDPRLAQVPDLDMWVRLCSRYDIHVLHEPLVEFRILDGEKNASAARPEVIARDGWERIHVLRRFLELDADTHAAAFLQEAAGCGIPTGTPASVQLARLALDVGSPAHNAFALELMFEALGKWQAGERGVPTYPEFIRLTGARDVLGLRVSTAPQQDLPSYGDG